jgi:IS605 OrfB family transposase
MTRTIAIRLLPTEPQAAKLGALQATYSAACNAAAYLAVEHRCCNAVKLHHLAYYTLRERFPTLGSQLACSAIVAVAQGLRVHRANGRDWKLLTFRREGSVHVDARTFRLVNGTLSIFTKEGRERVAMRLGAFQRSYLDCGAVRETDLVRRRDCWYLHLMIVLPKVERSPQTGVLGVDLGENIVAATSGGTLYGGGKLRNTRDRFLAFRKRLQGNGSQSAKQLLAHVSGRESRHVRHVNHVISAQIVAEAHTSGCGAIALENLKNIRTRIRMGKRMRTRLHRWAWSQLQKFVEYKAEAFGIAVVYLDPAFTSQTCSACGELGQRSRHRFLCNSCGIFAHSDRNAARNLAKIGVSALAPTGDVMRPHVAAQ